MTSTGVNVLRWSALGFGVIYGVYRQSTISAAEKLDSINKAYAHKESLISEAKAAFAKKNAPSDSKSGGIVSDPEDPKFDLEAYLKAAEDKA